MALQWIRSIIFNAMMYVMMLILGLLYFPMALFSAVQARAAINGRDYVLPDDVKQLAPYVITHRIILSPQMRLRGRKPEEIVTDIVNTVPVPVDA